MYNHIQYSITTKAVGGRYVRDVHPHGLIMSPLRLQQVRRLHELAEPGKRPSADHPKRSQKIEGSQPGRHGGPFEAYDKLRQRKQAKKKVEVLSWNRKILCSSSKPNLAGRFLLFLSCSLRSLQWKDSVLGPRVQGSRTNRILKSPWMMKSQYSKYVSVVKLRFSGNEFANRLRRWVWLVVHAVLQALGLRNDMADAACAMQHWHDILQSLQFQKHRQYWHNIKAGWFQLATWHLPFHWAAGPGAVRPQELGVYW